MSQQVRLRQTRENAEMIERGPKAAARLRKAALTHEDGVHARLALCAVADKRLDNACGVLFVDIVRCAEPRQLPCSRFSFPRVRLRFCGLFQQPHRIVDLSEPKMRFGERDENPVTVSFYGSDDTRPQILRSRAVIASAALLFR